MTTRKPVTRVTRLRKWLNSEQGRVWRNRLPALVVVAAAAWTSFLHLFTVFTVRVHFDFVGAALAPLSVDGLIIVSARYITASKTKIGKAAAVLGFLLGMAATLTGNVLAAPDEMWAQIGSAWPAVVLTVTGIIIHWGDKSPKVPPLTFRTVEERKIAQAAIRAARPTRVRKTATPREVTALNAVARTA